MDVDVSSAQLDAYLADCTDGATEMQCPIGNCTYTTNVKNNMKSHYRYVHGEKKFKCSYCHYSSASRRNVTRHEQVHAKQALQGFVDGEGQDQIILAGAEKLEDFGDYLSFTILGSTGNQKVKQETGSKVTVQNGNSEKRSLFKCDVCNFKSDRQTVLTAHMRAAHGNSNKYPCSLCHSTFSTAKHRSDHMVTSHGKSKTESRIKYWPCPICGVSATSEDILRSHIIAAHQQKSPGQKIVICKQCGFKASSIKALQHHVAMEHARAGTNGQAKAEGQVRKNNVSAKKFGCSKCSFTAPQRELVQQHIQVMHRKSDLRGKTTSVASSSNASKSVKFKCTKCFFIANSYNEFKIHSLRCRPTKVAKKPEATPKQFVLHNTTITLMDAKPGTKNLFPDADDQGDGEEQSDEQFNDLSFISITPADEAQGNESSFGENGDFDYDPLDPTTLMAMEFDDSVADDPASFQGDSFIEDSQNGSGSLNTPPDPYYDQNSDPSSPESAVPSPASLSLKHVMESVCHVLEHVAQSEIIINSEATHPYQCDYCDFDTGNILKLFKHMIKHTGKKFFKCSCASCQVKLCPKDSEQENPNGYANTDASHQQS